MGRKIYGPVVPPPVNNGELWTFELLYTESSLHGIFLCSRSALIDYRISRIEPEDKLGRTLSETKDFRLSLEAGAQHDLLPSGLPTDSSE